MRSQWTASVSSAPSCSARDRRIATGNEALHHNEGAKRRVNAAAEGGRYARQSSACAMRDRRPNAIRA
eukprot:4069109-Prymnesium_polylepis.1